MMTNVKLEKETHMIDHLRIECESITSVFPVIKPDNTSSLTIGMEGIAEFDLMAVLIATIGVDAILDYIPDERIKSYKTGGDNE